MNDLSHILRDFNFYYNELNEIILMILNQKINKDFEKEIKKNLSF